MYTAQTKPVVVFVLGGPGAGKGTQCSLIEKHLNFKHISAGECLREEWALPGSKYGEVIEKCMVAGTIVPVEITCALLKAKMETYGLVGGKFLIDGFPRNVENLEGWNRVVGDTIDVKFCLLLDCPELVMEDRLVSRGKTSGRMDDDVAIIRKRFETYNQETKMVVASYQKQNKCKVVEAYHSIENVWNAVRKVFEEEFTDIDPQRFLVDPAASPAVTVSL